jgi:DNA-binding transcriptional ArsR family regulator
VSPEVKATLDQLKILSDPSRLQILALLFDRDMSVSQIAQAMDITQATVHHHVNKLLEARLIRQTRTEVKGNLIEKYYRMEGRDVDSSELWDRVEAADRIAYRLSVMGMIKGLVNQAIKNIQSLEEFPYHIGLTELYPYPWRDDVIQEVEEVLREARERLAELEARYRDEPGPRITLLVSLLPTG